METADEVLGRNLAHCRTASGYTVRSLSTRLAELGCQVLPSVITKIEQGKRPARASEVLAFAEALGVNPNRILLPDSGEFQMTPKTRVATDDAWAWARGEAPLPGDQRPADDFRRAALPERLSAELSRRAELDKDPVISAAKTLIDRLRPFIANKGEGPDAVGELRGIKSAAGTLARIVHDLDFRYPSATEPAQWGDDDGER